MMGLFDRFHCQLIWQMTSILNLYPIIIDGDAYGTTGIMEHPMTKGIRQGFTQRFGWNLQFFFSCKAHYLATEGQVFEEKRHTSIKQSEEVSVCSLIVNEFHLVVATKASHAKQELRKLTCISEEQCCCIFKFPIREWL